MAFAGMSVSALVAASAATNAVHGNLISGPTMRKSEIAPASNSRQESARVLRPNMPKKAPPERGHEEFRKSRYCFGAGLAGAAGGVGAGALCVAGVLLVAVRTLSLL